MSPTMPTWRVLRSHQDIARRNARQALLVIQQRRREQAESDAALPAQRTQSATQSPAQSAAVSPAPSRRQSRSRRTA